MPAAAGTAYVDIKPDLTALKRGLNRELGGNNLGKLGARGGKAFAAGLSRAVKVGAVAATAGLVIETKRVVGAWREAEKVGAQTEAVLKSTGGAAGVTAKHIERLANQLSLKAGIDDEAVQSAENLLLTFTKVRDGIGKNNDVFTQGTIAITDMASAMAAASGRKVGQGDLKSATIQVGKALQDPVKGITALKRVGVDFDAQTKKTIESLVEQGKTLEAQKIILKELKVEFAGSGAANADAFDQAKVAVEQVEEALGALVGPGLGRAATGLADFLNKTREGEGGVARFIAQIRNSEGVGGRLRTWVEGAVTAVGRFVTQVRTGTGVGGQFRTAVENMATTVYNFGAALLPVVGGIGSLSLKVGGMALAFAGTKTGAVLLGAALGGLVARGAALGAIWAVGKVLAFASAIKGVATAIRTLSVATASTGIGALALVIGTAVGAIITFTGQQKKQKTSTDDVTTAVRAQREALIALRDIDLEGADAKLRVRNANTAVERAKVTLRTTRKQFGRDSLEAKEAENQLRGARLEQTKATREMGREEQRSKDKLEDATKATREAVNTAKGRVSTIKREIGEMRLQYGMLGDVGRKTKEGRDLAEKLRKKEVELTGAQGELNRALNRMPKSKQTTVSVKVKVADIANDAVAGAQGFLSGKGGFGGTPGVGPGQTIQDVIDSSVQSKVQQWAKDNPDKLMMLGGGNLGAAGQMKAITQNAMRFGLTVTSGFRRGDPGWHGKNRARDYAGPNMLAFAKFMARNFGSKLLELIHTPLGFGIKNGQRVPPYAQADHFDHVHVAYRQGGTFGGPKKLTRPVIAAAEEAPRHPEYFISTNPRDKKRSAGLLAQAAQAIGFARGGVYSGRELNDIARQAGFSASQARVAAAVALAESSGNKNAKGDGGWSHGLWQIYTKVHHWARSMNLFNPLQNAKAARRVFNQQGWGAWTMFKNGTYKNFLGRSGPAAGGSSAAAPVKKDPITGPRPLGFANAVEDIDRRIASPYNAVATGKGSDLTLQREKKRRQKARITWLESRIKSIDRRLAQKIPKSERTKLLAERKERVSELTSLYSDYDGTLTAITELKNPPPVEVPEDPAWAGIGARQAQAELTSWTDDDLAVAEEGAAQATIDYWRAIESQDPARIAETAGRLKEWGERLTGLRYPEPAAEDTTAADAAAANTESNNNLAAQIRALNESVAAQNAIASSEMSVGLREARRALADMISGEIGGQINARRGTAWSGDLAVRY